MITIHTSIFDGICIAWMGLAVLVHALLFRVTVPFGRHQNPRWGRTINNRLAWILMELPSLLIMLGFLIFGPNSKQGLLWLPFVLWLFHYTNRCFIFPLRMHANPKGMPIMVLAFGCFFNLINAGLNGYWLAYLSPISTFDLTWLGSWNFWLGLTLFIVGMSINWIADNILLNLRKPGETGYTLPRGFLFELVTSPNLLGEIIEWLGFAILVASLPAIAFALWTWANLVPRAKNHYDWSKKQFPDFPNKRKIIIPFLY